MSAVYIDFACGETRVLSSTTRGIDGVKVSASSSSPRNTMSQDQPYTPPAAKTVSYLLPHDASHDDLSHSDNSSVNNSITSHHDCVNGLSKSTEHCNHFSFHDTCVSEAHDSAQEGPSSPALLPSAPHATPGAVRVVPNPHTSVPAALVRVSTKTPRRQTWGTGHLSELDCAATEPQAQQAVAEGSRGRISLLDPSSTAGWREVDDVTDDPRSACDGGAEVSNTVQRDFTTPSFHPPRMTDTAPLGKTATVTRVASSLEETKVADIFRCAATTITTTVTACATVMTQAAPEVPQQPPRTTTPAPHVSAPPTTTAVEAEGMDHLTPARSTTSREVRYSRGVWNSRVAPTAVVRRSTFFAASSTALSRPLSCIPSMTVSPQAVVDHFHDAYRSAASSGVTTAAPPDDAGHPSDASSTCVETGMSQGYPTNLPGMPRAAEEMPQEATPDSSRSCSMTKQRCDSTDDGDEEDGPPQVPCTRRQSSCDHSDEDAATFAPLSVTPPNYLGTLAFSLEPPLSATASDNQLDGAACVATGCDGGGSSVSGVRHTIFAVSPPEAPSPPRNNDGEGDGGGSLPTSPSLPPFVPVNKPSSSTSAPLPLDLPERQQSCEISCQCGHKNIPPSSTTSAGTTTAGSPGAKPSSLPRRPPRPLFSNLSSPQQSSLAESTVNTPAKTRANSSTTSDKNGSSSSSSVTTTASSAIGGLSAATAAAEAKDKLHACRSSSSDNNRATVEPFDTANCADKAEKQVDGVGCRSLPSTSSPTSQEELDLARLVQQHVSQRIAQNYAQSCSYYLHYHSKPGSLTGGSTGRVFYSYPNSPEDHMWDDENLEEETAVAAAAVAVEVKEAPRPFSLAAPPAGTSCEGSLEAAVSRTNLIQQQPQRRRFSCAVPRQSST